ncbi:MAG: Fe-S cluster assembly protein NifU [Deltaproteobacteria bacterium]|jgi:NifU-like protein|nr:Fe-S cluster assembly protein NifU [Deltaproteobacteria bacterium]
MWEYSDKVRELFLNPKNVGVLEGANAIGEVGSLSCGDALKLFLKIENNRIVDATFQTFGCASAIASSSILTEMLKGKTVEEALTISNKEIAGALNGLPKEKMHCSVMGQEALEAAIRNWRGEPAATQEQGGEIVCKCFGVTKALIVKAIKKNNLSTVEEITNFTKAGGACGECKEKIQAILKEIAGRAPGGVITDLRIKPAQNLANPLPLTNIQRMQKIMSVLEEIVRPRLKQDGGDIELVDINGKTVTVALRGTCSSCHASKLTVEGLVQSTLREQVEPDLIVKENM